MEYEIVVGQNEKFLFRTDPKSIQSIDSLIRVFSVFMEKFPRSEGYYIIVEVSWSETIYIHGEDLSEKVRSGKGKGYLLGMKNKKRRAWYLAHILYDNLKKGMI